MLRSFCLCLLGFSVAVSAYDAPFTTDADLAGYLGDLSAWVVNPGGSRVFQHAGIKAVEVDGKALRNLDGWTDWLRVDLPAGRHLVTLRCREDRPLRPVVSDTPVSSVQMQLDQAKPGDEVIIPDGDYLDWRLNIRCSGTAQAPIVIRPGTPGGVTFMRNTRFVLTGSHVVIRNLRFDQCADQVITIQGGDYNRLTQLQFFHCGPGKSTFLNIVRLDYGSDDNRIDHCYFTGSKCMSIALRGPRTEADAMGSRNQIEYNVFRDIERIWINGQEAIQLGQSHPWLGRPETRVEHNLFDNVWGDSEIFSSKSNGNVFRYNVAAHCLKSGFCLRGGAGALVEGNVLVDNAAGIRVYGQDHRIVNNLFLANRGSAIEWQIGHSRGKSQGAPATNVLVAHNTFVGNGGGISVQALTDRQDWRPEGNRYLNNIFAATSGTYIDPVGQRNPIAANNLFQPGPGVQVGVAGEGPRLVDPQLIGEGAELKPGTGSPAIDAAPVLPEVPQDRYGTTRPVGALADLGAEECSPTVGDRPFLPPVPPVREWEADFYRAEVLEMSGNGDTSLPADFLLEFEYRPLQFATQATLGFLDGYSIQWGGADDKGIPQGLVRLSKRGEVVGEGPDTVYYRPNYVPSFPNNTVAIAAKEPIADLWYQGQLLVYHGEIRFSLNIADRTATKPRNVGRYASLIWQDRGRIAGPVPASGALALNCAEGEGEWRNVRVWHARDLRRLPPTAPVGVQVEPLGPQALALSWQDRDGFGASRQVELYRGTIPDFPLDAEHRVAAGRGLRRFIDFGVAPGTTYTYCLRAGNLAGEWADPVPFSGRTPTAGPFFGYCGATAFPTVVVPMARATDSRTGLAFVSGAGSTSQMKEPLAEGGYAEVAVTVPQAGTYAVWALVNAPDSGSDSFFVSTPDVNQGQPAPFYTGVGEGWFWCRVAPLGHLALAPGEHRLRFHVRESATRMAAVLVTNDLDWQPSR